MRRAKRKAACVATVGAANAVTRSDGIPRQFQLAGHIIKVKVILPSKWRHGKNCVGMWLPDKYEIHILSSCKGTNRQQVWAHEAVHALLDVAGHDDLSRQEQLVDRLGHLLQQMLTTME
jgi:hypothetical protein